ncbi:UDP-glucuronic acid decarboxylase family protein [Methanococcoides methylutens]|uniref:UDP-glucuronic acid decarboxylase family protein n=1 Tax=Methanococcoides methylutens TaxID=2226 RepID=UPI004043DF89
MRTLVTGGAGFMPSHMCDLLLSKGHEVICVDNLVTGNMDNIAHCMADKDNFTFIDHDISKPLFLDEDIDYIFHMASPASPVDYMELPIQTLKVGALGTYNMLGLAKEKGARILLASTSEVYGDPLVNPQPEEYWGNVNTIGPRGVYDEAKRYAEAITMAYHRYHNIDTRIVRIFNTYGPRMRGNDGRVVPNFVNQALKGEDITVYGDGSQTRSFCYVSDEVEGIYRLMMSDYCEPVNIGNPDEKTVLEFAETVINVTGSNSNIIYCDLPQDDPKVRRPDITKAKKILGWEPKVDLQDGLEKTVEYFRAVNRPD